MKKYDTTVGTYGTPPGMPITFDGKVIGVSNNDGTISITDPDFIKEINVKENQVMSISFKEEKS